MKLNCDVTLNWVGKILVRLGVVRISFVASLEEKGEPPIKMAPVVVYE